MRKDSETFSVAKLAYDPKNAKYIQTNDWIPPSHSLTKA